MLLEDHDVRLLQQRDSGKDLLRHVDAVAVLFHHAQDSVDLASGRLQERQRLVAFVTSMIHVLYLASRVRRQPAQPKGIAHDRHGAQRHGGRGKDGVQQRAAEQVQDPAAMGIPSTL